MIGVVFYPYFLNGTSNAAIQDVIAHIDYIKNLVGIDYVAIGSDFDGIEVVPLGLEDTSKFPNFTEALFDHGYTKKKKLIRFFTKILREFLSRFVGANKKPRLFSGVKIKTE